MKTALLVLFCITIGATGSAGPPARKASAAKPKVKALQDGTRKKLVLPFLGTIPAVRSRQFVELPSGNEESQRRSEERTKLTFTVFHTPKGGFVFAEYLRTGRKSSEIPVNDLEAGLRVVGQRFAGLAGRPPGIEWKKALESVLDGRPLSKIHQITVAYVDYDFGKDHGGLNIPTQPVFVITLHGFRWVVDRYDDPNHLGSRHLVDASGNYLRGDDRY